jgi:hypothetical protein
MRNRVLLDYYTASSGHFLPTFWDNLLVPSSGVKNPKAFLTPEDGADTSSWNVGKKLPLLAVVMSEESACLISLYVQKY